MDKSPDVKYFVSSFYLTVLMRRDNEELASFERNINLCIQKAQINLCFPHSQLGPHVFQEYTEMQWASQSDEWR